MLRYIDTREDKTTYTRQARKRAISVNALLAHTGRVSPHGTGRGAEGTRESGMLGYPWGSQRNGSLRRRRKRDNSAACDAGSRLAPIKPPYILVSAMVGV